MSWKIAPFKSVESVVEKGPLSKDMQGFRDHLNLELFVDDYKNVLDDFLLTNITTCNVMIA